MKILSLLLNILNIGIVAASVVALLPTAMLFDAPASQTRKSLWFLAGVFVLFPFVATASAVFGWNKWHAGDFERALEGGAVAPVYAAFAAFCLKQILDQSTSH